MATVIDTAILCFRADPLRCRFISSAAVTRLYARHPSRRLALCVISAGGVARLYNQPSKQLALCVIYHCQFVVVFPMLE